MEILVCIKQVADDSVNIGLNPQTGLPAIEDVTKVVNAFDTYAQEMAVRFKEAYGGSVTVISVGDDAVRESLKNCLAVGADQARQVYDSAFEGSDAAGVASALCAAIHALETEKGAPFDAIFFGRESTDYASGQVGTLVAEKLNRALITSVIDVEADGAALKVKKETEEGYCLLSAQTPAVLTVNKPDYEPRYATIKSKLAARKAAIPAMGTAELGTLDMQSVGSAAAGELVAALREPAKRAAGHMLREETKEETVRKLMDELRDAGVL